VAKCHTLKGGQKMNTEQKETLAQLIKLWNTLKEHAITVGMTEAQADAFASTEIDKLVDVPRMLQEVK
jgi:hypothetical protein